MPIGTSGITAGEGITAGGITAGPAATTQDGNDPAGRHWHRQRLLALQKIFTGEVTRGQHGDSVNFC